MIADWTPGDAIPAALAAAIDGKQLVLFQINPDSRQIIKDHPLYSIAGTIGDQQRQDAAAAAIRKLEAAGAKRIAFAEGAAYSRVGPDQIHDGAWLTTANEVKDKPTNTHSHLYGWNKPPTELNAAALGQRGFYAHIADISRDASSLLQDFMELVYSSANQSPLTVLSSSTRQSAYNFALKYAQSIVGAAWLTLKGWETSNSWATELDRIKGMMTRVCGHCLDRDWLSKVALNYKAATAAAVHVEKPPSPQARNQDSTITVKAVGDDGNPGGVLLTTTTTGEDISDQLASAFKAATAERLKNEKRTLAQ